MRYLSFLSLVILLGQACKPEAKSVVAPVLTVVSPALTNALSFQDTLFFDIDIAHELKIEYAKITVINNNQVPVLPAIILYPQSNNYHLVTSLVFDDFYLESGVYSACLTLGIGGEVFNFWYPVNYEASPDVFEGILAVVRMPNSIGVYSVAENNLAEHVLNVDADYLASTVSSYDKILYCAGNVVAPLRAYHLTDFRELWSAAAASSPPLPLFTSLVSGHKIVFVGQRGANIQGYSNTGQSIFQSVQFTNGYFTCLAEGENVLLSGFDEFNSAFDKLVVFNFPGGTVFRSLQIAGSIKGIEREGQNSYLVFVNHNDNGSAVYRYTLPENNLILLRNLPFIIKKDLKGSDNLFFLVSPEGLHWYTPASGSVVSLLEETDIVDVTYRVDNQNVYIARSNQFITMNLATQQVIDAQSFQGELLSIHLLYTR